MRVPRPVVLNSEQKRILEQCAPARSLPIRVVERARIVLLAAEGKQDKKAFARGVVRAIVRCRVKHNLVVTQPRTLF